MRLFIGLFLLSFHVMSATWTDLEEDKTYQLNQEFTLPQTIRSGSLQHFMKGEKFKLKEMTSLGSLRLMVYTFQYMNCPGKEMQTELEIIPVQGSNPMVEVGAQLKTDCELEVYVETRDLTYNSLFE